MISFSPLESSMISSVPDAAAVPLTLPPLPPIDLPNVPIGKHGTATVNVDNQHLHTSINWLPTRSFSFGGYADKVWGAKGWSAGAQAQYSW